MESKDYDKICDNLFGFFVAYERKIGFNQLLRSLNRAGLKISKPTLSAHLKHLTKKKFLKREEVGKQRVYYELNWNEFENLRDSRKEDKSTVYHLENKKMIQSFPLDEQMKYTANIITLKSLTNLKFQILSILDPDRRFHYNLEYSFLDKYYQSFVSWLLQSCKENKEEFREKALPLIDTQIELLKKFVFDKRPISNE